MTPRFSPSRLISGVDGFEPTAYDSLVQAGDLLPGWYDEWVRRLKTTEPWVLTWLRHNRPGPYWEPQTHGTMSPQWSR